MKRTLVILLLAPLLGGCMSVMSHAYRDEIGDIPRYYPGTHTDGQLIATPFRENEAHALPARVGFALIGLVDLPFTVVFDTLYLGL